MTVLVIPRVDETVTESDWHQHDRWVSVEQATFTSGRHLQEAGWEGARQVARAVDRIDPVKQSRAGFRAGS